MRTTEYLLEKLADLGVSHIFGIPGDYAIPFFTDAEKSDIRVVVTAHEPSAGFAADAYARTKGLGVAAATWGVGALNMLNAAAQAFAELSPVLFISGAPEISGRKPDRLLHHEIKDWDTQLRVYKEVTCSAVSLTDRSSACEQIDIVLNEIAETNRPGYIEIPQDIMKDDIEKRRIAKRSSEKHVSPDLLKKATERILQFINQSKSPVIYAGIEMERFGLRSELIRLVKKANLPVTTTLLGKSVFPETHPNFAGIYMGAIGSQTARELVENSDCVLMLGGFMTDFDSGLFTMRVPDNKLILVDSNHLQLCGEVYDAVTLPEIIRSLLMCTGFKTRNLPMIRNVREDDTTASGEFASQTIIETLNGFIGDDMVAVADAGDCMFSCVDLRANRFIAPAFYASMGFGVPAGIGAMLADPTRRPVVLVGDGAFQMTGVELHTAKKLGLNPIVIIFDDGYYGTLRTIGPDLRSFELGGWDYVAIAKALGCDGSLATNAAELRISLQKALESKNPYLIDAKISGKPSPPLRRLAGLVSKKTR